MGNRIETQNRLIEATRHLILTEGVEGCSLERICSQAGFSRGAFYSNFGTKEGLLAALAEDEYDLLIVRLRECVQAWSEQPAADGNSHAVMENLLFEALDTIGIDKNLYLLHSDLLMRSIRDPRWGARLLGLNNEFLAELSRVLETILQRAGRELTVPIRALTHSVIGIAMRAAGISAWRDSLHSHPVEYGHRSPDPKTQSEENQTKSIVNSPVRDIAEMILHLLYATSRPID